MTAGIEYRIGKNRVARRSERATRGTPRDWIAGFAPLSQRLRRRLRRRRQGARRRSRTAGAARRSGSAPRRRHRRAHGSRLLQQRRVSAIRQAVFFGDAQSAEPQMAARLQCRRRSSGVRQHPRARRAAHHLVGYRGGADRADRDRRHALPLARSRRADAAGVRLRQNRRRDRTAGAPARPAR